MLKTLLRESNFIGQYSVLLVSNVELAMYLQIYTGPLKIGDMNCTVFLLYQLKNVAFNARIMAQQIKKVSTISIDAQCLFYQPCYLGKMPLPILKWPPFHIRVAGPSDNSGGMPAYWELWESYMVRGFAFVVFWLQFTCHNFYCNISTI